MAKPKVAFICVHNSCRSQIAEALGKALASDVFESYSAGTETKPQINQDAVRLMKKLYGIDMEQTQYSKLISDMLSEVSSAADSMIYRLDVCFEHYPEFLKNPKIRQKVVGLLQKAKDYIVKLEGEFAYD